MDLVLIGAGPVGLAAATAALQDAAATRVRAIVDHDEVARTSATGHLGGTALPSADELPRAEDTICALVAFSSRAEPSARMARDLVDLGYHVITTCEELASPDPQLADGLDRAAKAAGRSIIATGANPGFAMDRLPVVVASASRKVRHLEVRRVVNTAHRRDSLVRKTGRGLTSEAFDDAVREGKVGHVGLPESARQIAVGLGWPWDGPVTETLDPVIDGSFVSGTHQTAQLITENGSVVLDLVMAWEPSDASDTIIIEGEPPVRLVIQGGYHGDHGTTAQLLAAIRVVDALPPGFHRPVDLPVNTHP